MDSLLAISWFKLTPVLLKFTLFGAEWVLWLLLGLSVLSLALIVERALYFYSVRCDINTLTRDVQNLLRKKDEQAAILYCKNQKSLESKLVLAGLEEKTHGRDALISTLKSTKLRLKLQLDKNLAMLGTLGANAAFVGLFGTALGIIKAFNDLKGRGADGLTLIIGSVSEALVATAVGIFVAVPAVVAFNLYGRTVKRHLTNMDAISETILAEFSGKAGTQGEPTQKAKA